MQHANQAVAVCLTDAEASALANEMLEGASVPFHVPPECSAMVYVSNAVPRARIAYIGRQWFCENDPIPPEALAEIDGTYFTVAGAPPSDPADARLITVSATTAAGIAAAPDDTNFKSLYNALATTPATFARPVGDPAFRRMLDSSDEPFIDLLVDRPIGQLQPDLAQNTWLLGAIHDGELVWPGAILITDNKLILVSLAGDLPTDLAVSDATAVELENGQIKGMAQRYRVGRSSIATGDAELRTYLSTEGLPAFPETAEGIYRLKAA